MLGVLFTLVIVVLIASLITYVLLPLFPMPPNMKQALTVIIWALVVIYMIVVLLGLLGFPMGVGRLGCS
jgi:hypothetical protein